MHLLTTAKRRITRGDPKGAIERLERIDHRTSHHEQQLSIAYRLAKTHDKAFAASIRAESLIKHEYDDPIQRHQRLGSLMRDRMMIFLDQNQLREAHKLANQSLVYLARALREATEAHQLAASRSRLDDQLDLIGVIQEITDELGASYGFQARVFWQEGKTTVALTLFRTADRWLQRHALYRLNNRIWHMKAAAPFERLQLLPRVLWLSLFNKSTFNWKRGVQALLLCVPRRLRPVPLAGVSRMIRARHLFISPPHAAEQHHYKLAKSPQRHQSASASAVVWQQPVVKT